METASIDGVSLTWDAAHSIARFGFEAETIGTGRVAEHLTAAFGRWVDGRPGKFALLADVRRLSNVDAGWRAAWASFFKARLPRGYLAAYGMNPIVRVAAQMFAIGTGVPLKAFGDETTALAWLREQGIGS